MCRALRVLCAAGSEDRLSAIKSRLVSVHWELVGGALDSQGLVEMIRDRAPDVIVLDVGLGEEALLRARDAAAAARIVIVGLSGAQGVPEGADAVAASPEVVKDAILGLPGPGGPVRR